MVLTISIVGKTTIISLGINDPNFICSKSLSKLSSPTVGITIDNLKAFKKVFLSVLEYFIK